MLSEMCVMDVTGDTKIIWDPADADQVEVAERTFKDLKKKGFLAYKVEKGGDKGEVIDKFDKHAEKLILAPPMKGG